MSKTPQFRIRIRIQNRNYNSSTIEAIALEVLDRVLKDYLIIVGEIKYSKYREKKDCQKVSHKPVVILTDGWFSA